ncbi:hypothetical protein C8J57DRAFT_1229890 [Mycena rebaudengoi]|nr:hypothetical protein C8J57DRAFT_1229890 [Mycena rebaudengoi]
MLKAKRDKPADEGRVYLETSRDYIPWRATKTQTCIVGRKRKPGIVPDHEQSRRSAIADLKRGEGAISSPQRTALPPTASSNVHMERQCADVQAQDHRDTIAPPEDSVIYVRNRAALGAGSDIGVPKFMVLTSWSWRRERIQEESTVAQKSLGHAAPGTRDGRARIDIGDTHEVHGRVRRKKRSRQESEDIRMYEAKENKQMRWSRRGEESL